MTIAQLLPAETDATRLPPHSQPIQLTLRIRLARNLAGYSFPGWCCERQRLQVHDHCKEAIAQLPNFSKATHLTIEALDSMERQYLVERHLISRELAEGSPGAAIIVDNTQTIAIMINEEDHLRIQAMSACDSLETLWKHICSVDDKLEQHLDYAFSDDWGYLTACPTNLGTGLRASAMLHLPGLVMTKQMDRVVRAVNNIGAVARGIFGESSDPIGSVFQISNQQTLGASEEEIMRRLSNLVSALVEQEHQARMRMFEEEGQAVVDRICRAYGILKYANLLNSTEAMNLLSLLRLASDISILPEHVRPVVDELMIQTQPAHLQIAHGGSLESNERDLLRAERIREAFADIPSPEPASISFRLPSIQQNHPTFPRGQVSS